MDQGDPTTVDFILISRPTKNDVNPGMSDPARLFSHHTCHCRQVCCKIKNLAVNMKLNQLTIISFIFMHLLAHNFPF